MSNVVAYDEAKLRLRPFQANAITSKVPIPAPEGVANIPRFHLGYPGCLGNEVPEPQLQYDYRHHKLLLSFEGSNCIDQFEMAEANAELAMKSGYKYSFRWIIAAYLVMNGVHFRQVPIWLPEYLDSAFREFIYLNNIELVSSDLLYSPEVECDGGKLNKSKELYSARKVKSENAPAFLKRVYAHDLAAGEITLSDLRQRDKTLWAGLRNWANAGLHDLDEIIPRGRTIPGRVRQALGFDPAKLDPSDPVQAAALKLAQKRAADRASAARSYSVKKAKSPKP